MTNACELVHGNLLAPLLVFLVALPRTFAQPFDREAASARVAPSAVRGRKLARAIVTIAAGELDKTSESLNPIPMPADGVQVRPPAFEGGQLLLRLVPAGLGGSHRVNRLAKSGLGLRTTRELSLLLFGAEVEDDRRPEAERRHFTRPSGPL